MRDILQNMDRLWTHDFMSVFVIVLQKHFVQDADDVGNFVPQNVTNG